MKYQIKGEGSGNIIIWFGLIGLVFAHFLAASMYYDNYQRTKDFPEEGLTSFETRGEDRMVTDYPMKWYDLILPQIPFLFLEGLIIYTLWRDRRGE